MRKALPNLWPLCSRRAISLIAVDCLNKLLSVFIQFLLADAVDIGKFIQGGRVLDGHVGEVNEEGR